MGRLARAFGAGVTLVLSFSAQAAPSCIWFADDKGVFQVSTDTNQISQTISLKDTRQLVMNAQDCGVWVVPNGRVLLQYDGNANLMQRIDLLTQIKKLGNIDQISIDPYDNSLWVSDGTQLGHVSVRGQLLVLIKAAQPIKQIAVALDESVWALSDQSLLHYDSQGKLLGVFDIGGMIAKPQFHAIDSLGGLLWLAGERVLAQLNSNQQTHANLVIATRHKVQALALNPLTGILWVALESQLLAYGSDGSLIKTVDLKPFGIKEPDILVFDPISQSLWMQSKHSVSRFDADGNFVVSLSTIGNDDVLAAPAFAVVPKVQIVSPSQNGLTNNPQLPLALAFSALCNDEPCNFANSYFKSYSLSATLNAQDISAGFVFDTNTAHSTFVPPVRLPEGQNTLSASVKDSFGHMSDTVTSAFTIDTIPPHFVNVTPADGNFLTTPQIQIQGTVDDPTARVVLQGVGPSTTSPSFSFSVNLNSGLNTFNLSAIDPAGNVTSQILNLTFSETVSLNVTALAGGATISNDSVTVRGTFQGPPNIGITVNGVVATVSGNTFIAASVPLQLGPNTLTVNAITPQGNTAIQTINVTSSGPAPIKVSASPQTGIAPLQVNFSVTNSTTNTITQITADFDGSGVSFSTTNPSQPIAFSYNQPGTYQATFNITDASGVTTTQQLTIVAQDVAQLDQVLKTAWNGFTAALASRNTAQVQQYLNSQAQAKYGPIFSALQPNLPQIVSSFTTPQLTNISNTLGEYVVGRTIDGVNHIFFIYFLRDIDGVWRIDSM